MKFRHGVMAIAMSSKVHERGGRLAEEAGLFLAKLMPLSLLFLMRY
jgi:hypothetical protein